MRIVNGLLVLVFLGCGCDKKSAENVVKRPAVPGAHKAGQEVPHQPAVTAPKQAAKAAETPGPDHKVVASEACRVKNMTEHPVELTDTAINQKLGTVAPGAIGSVGGHFSVKTPAGLEAQGYCSAGQTVNIILKAGRLHALGEDGNPAKEGAGE